MIIFIVVCRFVGCGGAGPGGLVSLSLVESSPERIPLERLHKTDPPRILILLSRLLRRLAVLQLQRLLRHLIAFQVSHLALLRILQGQFCQFIFVCQVFGQSCIAFLFLEILKCLLAHL